MTYAIPICNFHVQVDLVSETIRVTLKRAPGEGREIKESVKLPNNCSSMDVFGQELFTCVFPGKIKSEFEKLCSEKKDHIVRIIVEIYHALFTDNPLLHLPWEILHDGKDYLALQKNISIVRRLTVSIPKQEPQGGHFLKRLLLVSSEPANLNQFDSKEHIPELERHIQESAKTLHIKCMEGSTEASFNLALREHKPDILHYWGHSGLDKANSDIGFLSLSLDKNYPNAHNLSAVTLREWVKDLGRDRPRLVVLTSCHSGDSSKLGFFGVATALLEAGVEAVVAMQAEICSDEVIEFSKEFYSVLARGQPVDKAVQQARYMLKKLCTSRCRNMTWPGWVGTEKSGKSKVDAWVIPILYLLHQDGWLGLEPPKTVIEWPNPNDTNEMVYVPEQGIHPAIYLDKYAVSRKQYTEFAQSTGYAIPWETKHPSEWKDLIRFLYPDIKPEEQQEKWSEIQNQLPATDISPGSAKAYAEWAGKHLPTVNEWQTAARMEQSDPIEQCNTREKGLGMPWPVNHPKHERKNSIYNMIGNVFEIVQDENTKTFYVCGGSFKDGATDCNANKRGANPERPNAGIGFRCAANIAEYHKAIEQ